MDGHACLSDLFSSRNDGSLVSVLRTLLIFTIMMITLPIGLYFATKAYLFEGKIYYFKVFPNPLIV